MLCLGQYERTMDVTRLCRSTQPNVLKEECKVMFGLQASTLRDAIAAQKYLKPVDGRDRIGQTVGSILLPSIRSSPVRPLCAFSRIFSVDNLTANSRRALNRTDIALAHSSIAQLIPRRARSLVGRIDCRTSPA
jgi:hypothetical protein